jgi:hypothetical protein
MHQQQAVIMGSEWQNNVQTIAAASALPTTEVKGNSSALTVENSWLGDSSLDEEDLKTKDHLMGRLECFKAVKILY